MNYKKCSCSNKVQCSKHKLNRKECKLESECLNKFHFDTRKWYQQEQLAAQHNIQCTGWLKFSIISIWNHKDSNYLHCNTDHYNISRYCSIEAGLKNNWCSESIAQHKSYNLNRIYNKSGLPHNIHLCMGMSKL